MEHQAGVEDATSNRNRECMQRLEAVEVSMRPAVGPSVAILLLAGPLVAQQTAGSGSSSVMPTYAGGVVWVMPLPFTPAELARRLAGGSRQEALDSSVAASVTQYLRDQQQQQSRYASATAPSWTGKVAGQTVGLDTRYVYLGPLKLPAFLLGFLPLDIGQANPTLRDRRLKLNRMLEDIQVAGARGANLADFMKAVQQMEERIRERREFEANQRKPPPPMEDQPR